MQSRSRIALATTAAAGALTSSASAAFHVADFSSSPISLTAGSDGIYIDFDTAGVSTESLSGYDVMLTFDTMTNSTEKLYSGTVSGWSTSPETSDSTSAARLSFGDSIYGSEFTKDTNSFLDLHDAGAWQTETEVTGYLGYDNGVGQAWVKVFYDDAANSVSVLGVGYNDSGTLTAGQTASAIPEPASAAALAALLAGGIAAFRRRPAAA